MNAVMSSHVHATANVYSKAIDEPWKILIIDSDKASANKTAEALSHHGYAILMETSAEDSAARIVSEQPNLVLMDYQLTDRKGSDICHQIRAEFQGSILMLCEAIDDIDHILGLELGADECVCKQMDSRLLQAKVKAIRRAQERQRKQLTIEASIPADQLCIHDLVMETAIRQVSLSGDIFHLSAPEYDILKLLVENAGKIITREEIFLKVRGFEYDGNSRFVDVHISRLRQKIKAMSPANEIVKTVRGKGYLIIPDIFEA